MPRGREQDYEVVIPVRIVPDTDKGSKQVLSNIEKMARDAEKAASGASSSSGTTALDKMNAQVKQHNQEFFAAIRARNQAERDAATEKARIDAAQAARDKVLLDGMRAIRAERKKDSEDATKAAQLAQQQYDKALSEQKKLIDLTGKQAQGRRVVVGEDPAEANMKRLARTTQDEARKVQASLKGIDSSTKTTGDSFDKLSLVGRLAIRGVSNEFDLFLRRIPLIGYPLASLSQYFTRVGSSAHAGLSEAATEAKKLQNELSKNSLVDTLNQRAGKGGGQTANIQTLENMAIAYSEMGTASEKAGYLTELFGTKAKAAAPVMEQLGADMMTGAEGATAMGESAATATGGLTGMLAALGPVGIAIAGILIELALIVAAFALFGVAVYEAGAKLFAMSKAWAAVSTEQVNAAEKMRVSTETFTSLGVAAELAGLKTQDATAFVQSFSGAIRQAADGNEKMRSNLEVLGVNWYNAFKNPDKALTEFIAHYNQLPDTIEKNAALFAVFGDNAAEVGRIIRQTGGDLEDFKARMVDAGLALSEQGARRAEDFTRAQTRLSQAITSVTNNLAERFSPVATRIMNEVAGFVERNKETFLIWGQAVINVVDGVIQVFERLGNFIEFFVSLWTRLAATRDITLTLSLVRRLVDAQAEDAGGYASGSTWGNQSSPMASSMTPEQRSQIREANAKKNWDALIQGQQVLAKKKGPGWIVDTTTGGIVRDQNYKAGGGAASEVAQLNKEIEKTKALVESLRGGKSHLFDLQMELSDLQEEKSLLTTLLKLRRDAHQSDADRAATEAKEAEIRALNREKSIRAEIIKLSEVQLDAQTRLTIAQQAASMEVVTAQVRANTAYFDNIRARKDAEQQLTADIGIEIRKRVDMEENAARDQQMANANAYLELQRQSNQALSDYRTAVGRYIAAQTDNPLISGGIDLGAQTPTASPVVSRLDVTNKLLGQIATNTAGPKGGPGDPIIISQASEDAAPGPSSAALGATATGPTADQKAGQARIDDLNAMAFFGKHFLNEDGGINLSDEELRALTTQLNERRMAGLQNTQSMADLQAERANLGDKFEPGQGLNTQRDAVSQGLSRKVEIQDVKDLDTVERKLNALRRGDSLEVESALNDATKDRWQAELSTYTRLTALREEDKNNFINSEEFKTDALERAEERRRENMRALKDESIGLEDALTHQGEDASLRYEIAWKKAIFSVRDADIQAHEAMIAMQIQFSDKSVYHAEQANASVMQFLNQVKGVTDIIADAKIAVIDKTFGGIDAFMKKLLPEGNAIRDLLRQILSDLLKLGASKIFQQLFGLGGGQGQGGSGSGSGGGFFSSLLGGIFGKNAQGGAPGTVSSQGAGGSSGGGFFGVGASPVNQFHGGLNLSGIGGGDFTIPGAQSFGTGSVPNAFQGGLGNAATSAAQSGGFSLAGLASAAPLLGLTAGVGLGVSLGGSSPLGQILGGVGLGAVGAVAGSALPAILAGSFAGLTTLGAFTFGAGIALAIGAYIISKNQQRRKDETTRAQVLTDSKSKLQAILSNVNADRMDGGEALSAAAQIRGEYIQQVSQLKDKKTRQIALETVRELDAIITQIQGAVNQQDKRKEFENKFAPTFADGGLTSSASFLSNTIGGTFSGRVPGLYDRRDDKHIRVSGDEVVLTPSVWKPIAPYLASRKVPGVTPGMAPPSQSAFVDGGGTWGTPTTGGGTKPPMIIRVAMNVKEMVFEILNAPDGQEVIVETMKRDARVNREDGYMGVQDTVRNQL